MIPAWLPMPETLVIIYLAMWAWGAWHMIQEVLCELENPQSDQAKFMVKFPKEMLFPVIAGMVALVGTFMWPFEIFKHYMYCEDKCGDYDWKGENEGNC